MSNKMTIEEAMDIAFEKLMNMPKDEFDAELEMAKDDPLTKILEHTNMKDITLIPKGNYCYTFAGRLPNSQGYKINLCPYWKHRSEIDNVEFHNQNDGYCTFLGTGDIEMNGELQYVLTSPEDHPDKDIPMTADEIGISLSLLWDQVKMCGENHYTDEEEEEQYYSGGK
jgi:hypothetical protein